MASDNDGTADQPRGRVLVVAGSDSGGAAGIQADIKTITALGGYAMTAITAVTAQNTVRVHGVWPMPLEAVFAQFDVTLSDIGADAIKTGLLGATPMIEGLAERFAGPASGIPRVIDPVMIASSGQRLLEEKAVDAIRSMLVPGAALVTPNAPEAEILTGKVVESVDGQRRAAERLLEGGALGALVKGAHVSGDVIVDVLQTHDGEWLFEGSRLVTRADHGTGCTLASACAAHIAHGEAVPDAVERARLFLRGGLEHAEALGAGRGPVNHGWQIQKSLSRPD
ncbi:MAG: bifunctional hydroxymethylpyrimidine kinase/phosphomethylpyrimidine kinase [Pseudomonadota bacterium]